MRTFMFNTTIEESEELCNLIVDEMMINFGIKEEEAVYRVNAKWKGLHFKKSDVRFHEAPEDWAYIIYYGHDSKWWKRKDDPTLKPIPIDINFN